MIRGLTFMFDRFIQLLPKSWKLQHPIEPTPTSTAAPAANSGKSPHISASATATIIESRALRIGKGIGFKKRLFYAVMFLFFFAPFMSLLIYSATGSKVVTAIPALLRDVIVLLSFLGVFLARATIRGKSHTTMIYFMLLLLSIAVATLSSLYSAGGVPEIGELVKVLMNNIRRFIFPFVIFVYFYYFMNFSSIALAYRFATIFWCFGVFEYLMPLAFWESMGLLDYWNEYSNSTASTGKTQGSLQGYDRFFTFDTYYILGYEARRMISFYLEPTTTAALAQGSVVLGILMKRPRLVALAVIGGLLTFSKGFIVFLLGLAPLVLLINKANVGILKLYVVAVAIVLFGSLIAGYFLYLQYPQIIRIGLFAHLEGLYEYVTHFNPLGYGVGAVGSFRFEDNWGGDLDRVGVESSLANHISQLGVLGFASIALLFWHIKNILDGDKRGFYVLYMLIIYCFIFFTSNSATGYSGNFFIFFVIVAWFKYLSRVNPDILRRQLSRKRSD